MDNIYHSLEELEKWFTLPSTRALPRTEDYRYSKVRVLLLSWEEDDLGIAEEVEALAKIFKSAFAFRVEAVKIRSKKPHKQVRFLLTKLLGRTEENQLAIIYYSGHGDYKDGFMKWVAYNPTARKRLPFPTLNWSELQLSLGQEPGDVLLIFDSCPATGAVHPGGNFGEGRYIGEGGQTEIIASSGAVGQNSKSYGPGRSSFTPVLIAELLKFAKSPASFTTACLLRNITFAMNTLDSGHATPVHIRLEGNPFNSNIPLRSLRYDTLLESGLPKFAIKEVFSGTADKLETLFFGRGEKSLSLVFDSAHSAFSIVDGNVKILPFSSIIEVHCSNRCTKMILQKPRRHGSPIEKASELYLDFLTINQFTVFIDGVAQLGSYRIRFSKREHLEARYKSVYNTTRRPSS